jgi:hypothetical protein
MTEPGGTAGSRPFAVFAIERRDSANQVFVRWTNRGKSGREKRDRKGLGITVRDPETGRLDPKLVRAAELAVQQLQARLRVGRGASEETTSKPVRGAPAAGSAPTPSGLTLRAGFDLALDPATGKYGSNRTRRYDQMVKYRARLFGLGRHAAPLICRHSPLSLAASVNIAPCSRRRVSALVRATSRRDQ